MKRKLQKDMLSQHRGKIYCLLAQDGKHGVLVLSQCPGIVGKLIGQVNGEGIGDGSQAVNTLDLQLRGDLTLGEEPVVRAQEFDLSPQKRDDQIIGQPLLSSLKVKLQGRAYRLGK